MAIGISPTIDFAFKVLFGSPEHARITIHFLNAILRPLVRIAQITIQNPFLGKDDENDKLSVLDILAIDDHGRILNIEMQTTLPAGLSKRLAYYTASLYSGQLSEGGLYTSLRPAISICVLTQPIFPDSNELHLEFQLRTTSGLNLTDDLQIQLLQLSKLNVELRHMAEANFTEQWAYFMLHADRMSEDDVKRVFEDPVFSEAAGVLEMISRTPDQQLKYDARVKFQRDEEARFELARSEGLREGLREGMEKGMEKGALLGRISLLQELLGGLGQSMTELKELDQPQLVAIEETLQLQLRTRGR